MPSTRSPSDRSRYSASPLSTFSVLRSMRSPVCTRSTVTMVPMYHSAGLTVPVLPLLQVVLPRGGRVEAAAEDGDLGEPRVTHQPDHRAVRAVARVAAVDGPLGQQRPA